MSAALRRQRARADAVDEPEAVRMTGAMLCAECGWLDWRASGVASPHRQAADAQADATCPHCGASAWLDLRRESTALAIREGEEDTAAVPSTAVDVARKGALGVIAGTFIGVIATSSLVWGGAVAALCGVAAGLAGLRLRRLSVPPPRTLPDRWSFAPPPRVEGAEPARGVPACSEPMRSPISGQPCVAWEVGLRSDDDAEAELSTWALLEQRVAPFSLGDVSPRPDRVFLALRRTCIGPHSPEAVDAPALEWLRERGFSAVGSTLTLFESVIPLDAEVELRGDEHGWQLAYEAQTAVALRR